MSAIGVMALEIERLLPKEEGASTRGIEASEETPAANRRAL
jgi:hypothetical protein